MIIALRLDFEAMSGYTVSTFTTAANMVVNGVCTDKFEATGQTSRNPPEICGTNTGYHSEISLYILYIVFISIISVYVEFGAERGDTIELKTTYGDTSTKQWNILARQIACTSDWK